MKRAIFLLTLICFVFSTKVSAEDYIDYGYYYYYHNGTHNIKLINPGETKSVEFDIGTTVKIQIWKSDISPEMVTFWYDNLDDQDRGDDKYSDKIADVFDDIAGPNGGEIHAGIRGDTRFFTINATPFKPADLLIDYMLIDGSVSSQSLYYVGDEIEVFPSVYNAGDGAADPSVVGYYIGDYPSNLSNCYRYDSEQIESVDPGTNSTDGDLNKYYTFRQEDIGSKVYLICKADDLNDIESEFDETNNTAVIGPFTVQASQNNAPVLNITEPSSNISVTQGDDVSIEYNYETDDNATIDFYYRATSVSEKSDPAAPPTPADLIIEENVPADPGGSGSTHTMTWNTAGVSPNEYYIWGEINDGTSTDESWAPGTVTIVEPAELSLSITSPSEDIIRFEGGEVTISWEHQVNDVAYLDLYYSSNCYESGGIIIEDYELDPYEYGGSFTWHIPDNQIEPGPYVIWGSINNQLTPEQSSCAPGTVGIKINDVVLIHGLTGSSESWGDAETVFEEAGLDVYSFQYAQETEDDFNVPIEILASDYLTNFLNDKGINGKFNIIAHSMGGLIARQYILNNPSRVKRLITLDTPHYGGLESIWRDWFVIPDNAQGSTQLYQCYHGSNFLWNMHNNWETNQDIIKTEVLPIIAAYRDAGGLLDLVPYSSASLSNFGFKNCYVQNDHDNINEITSTNHNCYSPIVKYLLDNKSEIDWGEDLVDVCYGMLMLSIFDEQGNRIKPQDKSNIDIDIKGWPSDVIMMHENTGIYTLDGIWGNEEGFTHELEVIPGKELESEYKKNSKYIDVFERQFTVDEITLYPVDNSSSLVFSSGDSPPTSFETTNTELDFVDSPGGEVTVCKNDTEPPSSNEVKTVPHYWTIQSDMPDGSFNVDVELTYDETELAASGLTEDDLVIGYLSDEWVPLNTTLDKNNNTVSANLNHFSTFAIGDFSQSSDPGDDYVICDDGAEQRNVQIVSVGSGNSIAVWEDYRNGNWDIYAQKVDNSGNPLWASNGIEVCDEAGEQVYPLIVADGEGGAIVSWEDKRNGTSYYDRYVQRLYSNGNKWAQDLLICNGAESRVSNAEFLDHTVFSEDGVIITWWDWRSGVSIYAQKIDLDGNILWSSQNGEIVSGSISSRDYGHKTTSDGAGGAIIAWYDGDGYTSDKGVLAQRINSSGDKEWGDNAKQINSNRGHCSICKDGLGGAIVSWEENGTIKAERINDSGNKKWNSAKTIIDEISDCHLFDSKYDNNSSVIFVWENNNNVYSQKIAISDGTKLWQSSGIGICTDPADQDQTEIYISNSGEASIVWRDYRNSNYDIYYQKLDSNGNPQKELNGIPICEVANEQEGPRVVENSGTVTVVWNDNRNSNWDIYGNSFGGLEPSIPPVLSWSSEIGFVSDGVNPNKGFPNDPFEFRVVYSDEDGDPPLPGYPKLFIDSNGDGDTYDAGEGIYTMNPVSSETDFINGKEYYYQISLPEPPEQNYWYKFSAEDNRLVAAEGDPTGWKNNLKVGVFPDLVVNASGINFSDTNPETFENFDVSVVLRNDSDQGVDNVGFHIYSRNSNGIDTSGTIPYLGPNSTETIVASCSFHEEGYYFIEAVVDENGLIVEWDENNNKAARPIPVGSIAPASIKITEVPNSAIMFAGSNLYLSGHASYSGTVIPDYPVLGALVTYKPSWTEIVYTTRTNDFGDFNNSIAGPSEPGTYSMGISVTDFTLNGDTTITVQVQEPPIPDDGYDLAIYVSATRPCENGSSDISWYVKNVGNEATPITTTAVLIIEGDTLATESVPILQPNEDTRTQFVSRTADNITGRTVVQGIADPIAGEIRTSNNTAYRYIEPYPLCVDLTPKYVYSNASHPQLGQEVTFYFKVYNIGCYDSQPADVLFSVDGEEDSTLALSAIPGKEAGFEILQFTYTFDDCESHYFTFDIVCNESECDITNNSTSITLSVPGPDLKILPEDITHSDCRKVDGECVMDSLGFKVMNIGITDASDVLVRLLIDGEIMGDTCITLVQAGDTVVAAFEPYYHVSPDPGHFVAEVCADPDNMIDERYENNNCATRDINLTEDPCSVALISFVGISKSDGINLTWELSGDFGLCLIERKLAYSDEWQIIASGIEPFKLSSESGSYCFTDKSAEINREYIYRIIADDGSGTALEIGTVEVTYSPELPKYAELLPNCPNPFNPSTKIRFALPEKLFVSIRIYDVRGHLVNDLFNGIKPAGHNSITWKGKDKRGNSVSSGIYFCRMKAGKFTKTRKMVLLR